jgi:4-hydroxy-tetrahydrodipicolinate reductase
MLRITFEILPYNFLMIRVLLYGLGPIGAMMARQLAARDGFRVVGAVDVDPAKVGRDVDDLAGLGRPLRVKISPEARRTLKQTKPDIVVLCTASSMEAVMPQIEDVLSARVPLVTTTEELSYPVRTHAGLAKKIDAMARRAKVAVLSTGVNPGFAMDTLPIVLTAASERIESVTVNRVQDARSRRLPFQQKIGAGLTREQFAREVSRSAIRHVGLAESITMIADALSWKLDRITDDIKPKISEKMVTSEYLAVDPGCVAGIVQDGMGYRHGAPVIKLHMEAYLGAPESYDSVHIEGVPKIDMKIAGGIPGDIATVSVVLNSIPKVLRAKPGLHTMRDLPLPSYFAGRGF